MNEKKTFKQQIKDWWNDNKRVIKVGIAFGALGVAYGFIKGGAAVDKLWLEHGFERALDDSVAACDDLGLTEENCGDPEFAEIVKFENKHT